MSQPFQPSQLSFTLIREKFLKFLLHLRYIYEGFASKLIAQIALESDSFVWNLLSSFIKTKCSKEMSHSAIVKRINIFMRKCNVNGCLIDCAIHKAKLDVIYVIHCHLFMLYIINFVLSTFLIIRIKDFGFYRFKCFIYIFYDFSPSKFNRRSK